MENYFDGSSGNNFGSSKNRTEKLVYEDKNCVPMEVPITWVRISSSKSNKYRQ